MYTWATCFLKQCKWMALDPMNIASNCEICLSFFKLYNATNYHPLKKCITLGSWGLKNRTPWGLNNSDPYLGEYDETNSYLPWIC